MKGKKGRLFMGDVEVGNVKSWEIKVDNPIKGEEVSFTAVFKPKVTDDDYLEALFANGENEVTMMIYGPDGEKLEARMKILVDVDGQMSLEPIDKDVRELINGWILRWGKSGI